MNRGVGNAGARTETVFEVTVGAYGVNIAKTLSMWLRLALALFGPVRGRFFRAQVRKNLEPDGAFYAECWSENIFVTARTPREFM